MIHGLSPRIRRLGAALVLLAVLLLVFGGGLHLGDHCHEEGHEQECALAVLLVSAALLAAALGVSRLTPEPRPLPVYAHRRRRRVDLRIPGARAPPSRS